MPTLTNIIDLNGNPVVISTTQTISGQWSWRYTMDGVTRVGGASYWTRNRALKEAVVTAGRTINAIYGMDATHDDGGNPGMAPVRNLQWVRAATPDRPPA